MLGKVGSDFVRKRAILRIWYDSILLAFCGASIGFDCGFVADGGLLII